MHPLYVVTLFITTFLITYVGCNKHPHTAWSPVHPHLNLWIGPNQNNSSWGLMDQTGPRWHFKVPPPSSLSCLVTFGSWQAVWVLDGREGTSKHWSVFRKNETEYGQQEAPTNQGRHSDQIIYWDDDIFFWETVTVAFVAARKDIFLHLDKVHILHTSSWAAQGGVFVQIFWRK